MLISLKSCTHTVFTWLPCIVAISCNVQGSSIIEEQQTASFVGQFVAISCNDQDARFEAGTPMETAKCVSTDGTRGSFSSRPFPLQRWLANFIRSYDCVRKIFEPQVMPPQCLFLRLSVFAPHPQWRFLLFKWIHPNVDFFSTSDSNPLLIFCTSNAFIQFLIDFTPMLISTPRVLDFTAMVISLLN